MSCLLTQMLSMDIDPDILSLPNYTNKLHLLFSSANVSRILNQGNKQNDTR